MNTKILINVSRSCLKLNKTQGKQRITKTWNILIISAICQKKSFKDWDDFFPITQTTSTLGTHIFRQRNSTKHDKIKEKKL